MTQMGFWDAKGARNRALAAVSENAAEWMPRALACISRMPPSLSTGEDIRLHVAEAVGNPHHHNAYGALVRTAIKRGYIVFANEYRAMRTTKSHARKTPVYRVEGRDHNDP